jgi:hexokinase
MQHFRYRPEILEGLPDDILRIMKQFEDWFTIETDQLKLITNHFVKELEKGLTVEGGSIVSGPSH